MNFRLVSSRSLMIFFAITITLVAHTDAGTSSSECAYVHEICFFTDAVCSACMTDYDKDQYAECREDAVAAYLSENTLTENVCEYAFIHPCCLDAASSNDCMSNDAFVHLNLCIYSDAGAMIDADECTTLTCSWVDGVDDPEILGENGAFRADVFSVRALLGLTLGVSMFVAAFISAKLRL